MNGHRQFRVDLKKDIPSFVFIAGHKAHVRYPGQPRTCFRCGETGHEAKGCPNTRCGRCLRLGHVNTDCTSEVVCSLCGKEGHVFRVCPSSFVAMVKGEGQSNATSSAAPVTEVHPTEDPEPTVSPVKSPPVSRSAGPAPGAFVLSSSGSEEALECPPVSPVLASPVTSEARRSPVPVPRLLPPKPNEKAG